MKMKKFCLLLILIQLCSWSSAQDNSGGSMKKKSRYFIGASYSYISIDMKLSSLSFHSVWYGSDLGTRDMEACEIDTINDFVKRNSRINSLNIKAGMDFINETEDRWKLSGTLLIGIAQSLTTVHNNETGVEEYSFNSGFSKPCLGLGINFGYQFNKHWELSLRPYVVGTMGTIRNITDRINPDPINFSSDKEDKFHSLYLHCSMLAGYTAGPVTILAGPGLYYTWSKHEYRRNYTNINDGQTLMEEVTYGLIPRYYIDGNLAAVWNIIDELTLQVHAGIGYDLILDAGLNYNF